MLTEEKSHSDLATLIPPFPNLMYMHVHEHACASWIFQEGGNELNISLSPGQAQESMKQANFSHIRLRHLREIFWLWFTDSFPAKQIVLLFQSTWLISLIIIKIFFQLVGWLIFWLTYTSLLFHSRHNLIIQLMLNRFQKETRHY